MSPTSLQRKWRVSGEWAFETHGVQRVARLSTLYARVLGRKFGAYQTIEPLEHMWCAERGALEL